MGELVDKQAVLRAISELSFVGYLNADDMHDAVEWLPVVEERKKGQWIDRGDYCVCNQCWHMEQQFNGVEPIPWHTPFCAGCGADMRERRQTMPDAMTFPKTLDDFMEQYKIVDTEQVYTNGTALVPIFRIKQWEDAHQQKTGKKFIEIVAEYPDPEICIYTEYKGKPYFSIRYEEDGEKYEGFGTYNLEVLSEYLKEYFLPSAQPARQRGKWIEDGYYKIPAVCSRCGSPGVIDFKYCPYCGARMNEEETDDETN